MASFSLSLIERSNSSEISRENFELSQDGITAWLVSKNIILPTEILYQYQDITPWLRTGGETYGTIFSFSTDKRQKSLFVKALVTTSPEKSLKDWWRRRNILHQNDIPVSQWYHFGAAVIIEDFYPNTAHAVSFDKILAIGYKLDKLGFVTLKFCDDIRADIDGNPYFIDFGFDLGEPTEKESTTARSYLLKLYPEKAKEINAYYGQKLL